MPELPEVHTTVEGLRRLVKGKTVKEVWSEYHLDTAHGFRLTLKNKQYYEDFKKIVIGKRIVDIQRRGKNILVNLNNGYSFIIHMKMTGHIMVGKYEFKNKKWIAKEKGPLQDPYNQYIHFVCSLSDQKQMVLSDMRKFASVTISKTKELHLHENVGKLGIDALDKNFNYKQLKDSIKSKRKNPIKNTLLDQTLIAGIGNIYSDEILWETDIHPLSESDSIPDKKFPEIFKAMQDILNFSIKHGGDSKSDYRNVYGEKGGFQNFHKVYGKRNEECKKINCKGIIKRIVVKGRSSHFCPKHQVLYQKI